MAEIVKPDCYRCHGKNVKLRRKIIGNGSSQVVWWCLDCELGAVVNCPPLKHLDILAFISKWEVGINDLPVIKDYSAQVLCAVCGKPNTEYHHWAPQSYYKLGGADWFKYPGAYLCKYHHHLWHAIVTPTLTTFKVPDKEIDNG